MKSVPSHKSPAIQFTDIHFDDEIAGSVKSAKSELKSILSSVRDRTATISYKGQIITAVPADFPRLLAEWSSSSKVDHAVRNIVASSFFSAEEKCSGSAIVAAGLWISGADLKSSKQKNRCRHEEMSECISYFGGHGLSLSTAQAVINLGGLGCRVEHEETVGPVTKIVTHSGTEILGEIDHLFGDRVGRDFDFEGCAVIAVDGAVESVSSLHFALESSVSRPVVILAGHFLPDVSNTLAENWRLGRGKCLPFRIKKWPVENFLDLEKQGILCVSFERGDTFSGLKLESNSELRVDVNSTSCTVSGGHEQVNSKLTVQVSQTLGGLTGLVKDRVKMLVGFARQCSRSGVTKWEELFEMSQDFSALYSRDLAISSSSLVSGAKASESLRKVLQELGCVILVSPGDKK